VSNANAFAVAYRFTPSINTAMRSRLDIFSNALVEINLTQAGFRFTEGQWFPPLHLDSECEYRR
jgi:hypothetical protein